MNLSDLIKSTMTDDEKKRAEAGEKAIDALMESGIYDLETSDFAKIIGLAIHRFAEKNDESLNDIMDKVSNSIISAMLIDHIFEGFSKNEKSK